MKMRFRLTLLLVLLAVAPRATAQDLPAHLDPSFPAAALDPLLIGEAEAVVRAEIRRFEVENEGEAREKVRRVVTVLSAEGREAGRLMLGHDSFRKIKDLDGRLLDARGEEIRDLGKQDVSDYSAIQGFSLYEDNRVRVAELYHGAYPYTVEFEYEIEHDGLIGWPTWHPEGHGLPVEYARYEVEAPAEMPVRYAAQGTGIEPEIAQGGKRKTYRWTVERHPAWEAEPYGPSWREQIAAVHVAPETFAIEGTRGDLRSWKAFGRWYGDLSRGRAELPAGAVEEARAIVAGAADRREAVRRLYRHMQRRTRYVSIQLGIGGWQPFEAEYVHARGYGDCKALVNYMQALLKAVGIEAHPALIRSGTRVPDVLPDFPSSQFNHVILAVPMEDGSLLWLECTSQTMPFGHIGAGNESRHALLVTEEGGRLVQTPRSAASQNQQIRRARVTLSETGDATAEVRTTYTGNQQDRVRRALAGASGHDRMDWLRKSIDASSFKIQRADFAEADAHRETITLPVELSMRRYAAPTGTRLFVPLAAIDRWTRVPPPMERPRAQPIAFFPYAFADADTVTFALPEGYAVEAAPAPVTVETDFARYTAEVVPDAEGTLVYTRRFEVTEVTLPPERYGAFRDFLAQVTQADRAQVVLVRQE